MSFSKYIARVCAGLLAIIIVLACPADAQVLTYTTDPGGALASVAANATGTSLLRVNGAATPGAPCGSGYSVLGFTTATVYNSGLPAVEVTVTPDPGFTLNVTGFTADMRRSGSGPASIRYAYSTDGGATWIDQGTDQAPNNGSCGSTATGSWTTSVAVSAPLQLTFRLYGYNAGSSAGTLQLMNLVIDGIVSASPSCAVPPGLTAVATTSASANLSWTAITGAIGYNIHYRPSGSSTWLTATAPGNSTTLSGLSGGTVYECEVETICASGTSGYSATAYFTTDPAGTASASSGRIAIYFNHPVNTAVSSGVNAVYLHNCMADTLIAYLDRAQYTVDIAQYDYNQSAGYSSIADAINNCITRGVRVRWIYDGGQSNTGLALLSPSVHTLASPTTSTYGLMHNKVVIIDAESADPNDAVVCTGSTVWGVNQFNVDYNNMIFVQDSALAHAYLNHFNMMWGDTGSAPNLSLSKFGPMKSDLGAHYFNIGGKTVELYFSPADHTDAHIQAAINSANTDLYFGVFTFTMSSDASAILARNGAGVYTPGIVDENSTLSGSAYTMLSTGLGSLMKTQTGATIYHNKMMIVDPSNTCSDPLVLTGSHNWTNSAETKNDENTLIIHSDTVANIYYQSFHANYSDLGGTLTAIPPCAVATCGTPSGLFTSSVGTSTAILHWSAVTGALSYTIQYRVAGAASWSSTSSAANSVTLTSLTDATTYEFQVQAICAAGTGSFSGTATFTTLAPPCSTPGGLAVIATDTDAAVVSWVAAAGAVSYNVEYRVATTTTWLTASSATNNITLSSLVPGTLYEYRVLVVCASGTSAFSVVDSFTTDALPIPVVTCPVPGMASIPVSGITGSSAVLSWMPVPGALSYKVRYHVVGTPAWTTIFSTVPTATLSGLTPWTDYEFQVQAVCDSVSSGAFSGSVLFTTAPVTKVVNPASADVNGFIAWPNPSSGAVTLSYSLGCAGKVSLSVYDITGRLVQEVVVNEQQPGGQHIYSVTLPDSGVYLVKLAASGASYTARVVRL